jgi:hypothetical protein
MEAQRVRALITTSVLVLLAAGCITAVRAVPLPRPRPALPVAGAPSDAAEAPETPSACRLRLTEALAIAPSLPPITGPGECGAPDIVRLEAVVMPDHSRVTVAPPAVLRCTMAEAIVSFVREEAAPRALDLGSPLRSVINLASFDCRGRNGIPGAPLSEHGKANALDIAALKLASGRVVGLTDPQTPKDFREDLKQSVCARFTTVLGPGSDGYHEEHVHVDLAERRNGYRLCEWDVREPGSSVAAAPSLPSPASQGGLTLAGDARASIILAVPLPRPRPLAAH